MVGLSANVPNVQSPATAPSQRPADGDFTTPGAGHAPVKDSDGDYKPLATAQNLSSNSVQAAVSNLKVGG